MEDLIFEGFLQALVVLGVMHVVNSFASDINLRQLLNSAVWYKLLIVLYWLGCMLFASVAISGFINFSKPDITMSAFLFIFMVGVGIHGLKTRNIKS